MAAAALACLWVCLAHSAPGAPYGPTWESLLNCEVAPPVPARERKSLVDYFLPMEPRGPLVSEGIWGHPNVLPHA